MPSGSWERVATARLRSLARVVRPVSHTAAGVENTLAIYLSLLGTPDGNTPSDAAKRQRYLDTMDTQRRRLSALFNAVFAYLPPDTGTDNASDLEQSFRHAAVLAGTLAAERGVTLDAESDGASTPPMQIRRECIRQAILDGLLLAVEHTPAGAAVAARLSVDGETARLSIRAPAPEAPPTPTLPSEFVDCQEDLHAIGGTAHWNVAHDLHIELELPCSSAKRP